MAGSCRAAFYICCAVLITGIAAPPGRCADSPNDPVLSVQADPCFVGRIVGDVTPIAVTITNNGPATCADLDVHNRNAYQASNHYHAHIDLAGDGAKNHVVVYPATSQTDRWSAALGYTVEVDTPGHSLSVQVVMPVAGQTGPQIALLGDNLGAISPSRATNGVGSTALQTASYVKPENAPVRSVAYAGLSTLVLGDGVERLDSDQLGSIREWVVSGGSLILLGKDYLKFPQFDELSPVTPRSPEPLGLSKLPRISSHFLLSDLPADPQNVMLGDLKPGSESLEFGTPMIANSTIIARRQLGAGTVLFFGMDPTKPEFRNWSQLSKLWETLCYQAAPVVSDTRLTSIALAGAPWSIDENGNYVHRGTATDADDPFQIALPPLPTVVYLFVAYFVLAVPVSFVVLKRTRRMNLAWVTGPLLAVGFGAALFLFTARLNTAPLSRRTVGVITAVAGEKVAHFSGATEMFFPRAGSYDVTIPSSDSVELFQIGSGDSGPTSNQNHGLDIFDVGAPEIKSIVGTGRLENPEFKSFEVRVPDLNVANLSFRRLYHTQSIDWGGGIDSDITPVSTPDGSFKIAGRIMNATGRPLRNVWVAIPKQYSNAYGEPILLQIGEVNPGVNDLGGKAKVFHGNDSQVPYGWRNVSAPTLYATTSASDFGPALGKYVGGDDTAHIVVSLPGLKMGGAR